MREGHSGRGVCLRSEIQPDHFLWERTLPVDVFGPALRGWFQPLHDLRHDLLALTHTEHARRLREGEWR